MQVLIFKLLIVFLLSNRSFRKGTAFISIYRNSIVFKNKYFEYSKKKEAFEKKILNTSKKFKY